MHNFMQIMKPECDLVSVNPFSEGSGVQESKLEVNCHSCTIGGKLLKCIISSFGKPVLKRAFTTITIRRNNRPIGFIAIK